jgi:hypothetical protein
LRRRVYDYGSRETDDEQSGGERRKTVIVKYEAEGGGGHAKSEGVNLRSQQVTDGSDKSEDAEHSIAKKKDRNLPHHAGGRAESGLAGKPHRRILDHEITHIQRITECGGTQRNQQIGGARRGQEGSRMHRPNLPRR